MESQKQKGVKAKPYLNIFLEAKDIINLKEAEVSPICMGKATMGPRVVMVITTESQKEVELSPIRMGKAIMDIRRVMGNPMAIKHRPTVDMAVMENMALVPSNMSCAINTS